MGPGHPYVSQFQKMDMRVTEAPYNYIVFYVPLSVV